MCKHTLLSDTSALVELELLVVAGLLNRGVASGASEGELHGLVEEVEALDLLDGLQGGLRLFKDDEGLALGLQVGLGDDVDDGAVFGEDGVEGGLEGFGLDALFEVAHVDTVFPSKFAVSR